MQELLIIDAMLIFMHNLVSRLTESSVRGEYIFNDSEHFWYLYTLSLFKKNNNIQLWILNVLFKITFCVECQLAFWNMINKAKGYGLSHSTNVL